MVRLGTVGATGESAPVCRLAGPVNLAAEIDVPPFALMDRLLKVMTAENSPEHRSRPRKRCRTEPDRRAVP
jgi:hypothetical protein